MIITRNVHKLTIWLGALALAAACVQVRAVDYHVATAQDLQNALTLAAANGANNNIYVTNGYYIGNFNYNSSAGYNLVVTNEPGVTNTQITIDGAGGGRALSITSSGTSAITVSGITFSRNCGSTTIGALRIGGGAGSVILVNGCQFLSPTNTSGMGLEIASGLNATLTNCTATGAKIGGGGTGISVSGVTGNVGVQNCLMTTNSVNGLGVSGAGVVAITDCIFAGNLNNGASCSATTITVTSNTFTGNGANSTGGGGAYFNGAATLNGNTFNGNTAGNGNGGGAVVTGAATLTGNTFTGNRAGNAFGGGVYCSGSNTALTNNTFTGNSASGPGGGGTFYSATTTLTGNNFTGNSAGGNYGGYGGGVFCNGTLTLNNNSFTGNSAPYGPGGGVGCYLSGATMTIYGNTFQQNNAVTGGGIYASGKTINILENLVVKNSQTSSSSQGGGVWVDATSNLFMINNTITGNTAAGSGGGVAYQVDGVVELLNVYNNIIWGNTANGNGGDVWLTGTGQKKVFDFNDADSIYGVWDIALNNIDLSPQFFDPVNGDYHIQSTSPCKDAGTNGAPSLPATDLDGGPRIANGTVDLGCYEFSTAAAHPADTDTNFVLTATEFNAYAAAWKAGQTWTNGPNPIPANYVTRAGYLMTNGGTYHNDGSARPVNWKTGP
jgi:hypothetical protein